MGSRMMQTVCQSANATSTDDGRSTNKAPTFNPPAVDEWADTGLPEALLESLVTKHLFASGEQTGRSVAAALCAPPKPVLDILQSLKNNQLVYYKDTASMGDFTYALSDAGRDRARKCFEEGMYVGALPVTLKDYVESVAAQSIRNETPKPEQVRAAFADLLLADEMFERLGPAINSGRGLFLYGVPGNGKTSIAERIAESFNTDVWVPRAIFVEGEIIKFYDPQSHARAGVNENPLKGDRTDPRWVKIKRPTIVVGGELTMQALELQYNPYTKITEPSVQLKSNCGVLVIDDFGRQRMDPVDLLNRWIVPLEKRFDYLSLSTGTKIQVPFDQLIVFSTNLEPRELVDDAFLRRIPYKLNISDPSEPEFIRLMRMFADQSNIRYDEESVRYLIDTHYKGAQRRFRCCHPRDLITQIINRASYLGEPAAMSKKAFDMAVTNYFAVL